MEIGSCFLLYRDYHQHVANLRTATCLFVGGGLKPLLLSNSSADNMPVHACVGCVLLNLEDTMGHNFISVTFMPVQQVFLCSTRCEECYYGSLLKTPKTSKRMPMELERVLPFPFSPTSEIGTHKWFPIMLDIAEVGTQENPIDLSR